MKDRDLIARAILIKDGALLVNGNTNKKRANATSLFPVGTSTPVKVASKPSSAKSKKNYPRRAKSGNSLSSPKIFTRGAKKTKKHATN